MKHTERLSALGLFDQRVPRYTSYPTAPVFDQQVQPGFQAECLRGIDPAQPVSVYVHIPFASGCAGFAPVARRAPPSMRPVEAYLATLDAELGMLRDTMPAGAAMAQLHWGGGTPTILLPIRSPGWRLRCARRL